MDQTEAIAWLRNRGHDVYLRRVHERETICIALGPAQFVSGISAYDSVIYLYMNERGVWEMFDGDFQQPKVHRCDDLASAVVWVHDYATAWRSRH